MNVYDIALTMIPHLGAKGVAALLDIFVSAERVFRASAAELNHFALLRSDLIEAIVKGSTIAAAERELKHCARYGITPIASTDEAYPPLLREVDDRPHVLYVKGNPAALRAQCVSVVGTRRMSSYGDRMCNALVHDLSLLAPNLCIVSGLAYGVDASAHRAALHHGVATVAVLATPLHNVTPTQHRALSEDIIERNGAIITECHSNAKAHKNAFITRNRIVAALSGVTIVVESPTSGGSMVTAGIAHSYGRSVMALPGRLIDSSSTGCNMLIRNQVAQLYLSGEQVIREMMWDCPAPSDRAIVATLPADLSPEETQLLALFDSSDPVSLESLCQATNIEPSELSVLLMQLELQGLVRVLPGNLYERLSVITTL